LFVEPGIAVSPRPSLPPNFHVVLSEEPEVPEDMDTEESPILDDLRYHLFSIKTTKNYLKD
jgi:hypothetical protein